MTGPRPNLLLRPTTVYRLFDDTGTLLYVGLSGDPVSRFSEHRSFRPWWSGVRRIELIPFENRIDAIEEEARAIDNENPRHNITATSPALIARLREQYQILLARPEAA